MPGPALVGNAASGKQVKEAKIKEKFNREDELADVKAILDTKYGRRFLWKLLDQCGVFRSVWVQSAQIHYLAGQQDIGHYIMDRMLEADQEGYFLMQKENGKPKGD